MRTVEGIARIDDLDAFLAEIGTIRSETGATVQVFDAGLVVSRVHLERAVELADRARDRDEAVARDRAVEWLLYAAGRRQIDRALTMGVSEGETPAVGVVDGGDEAAAADRLEALLEPASTLGRTDEGRVRGFFGISERELDATAGDLADVVLERVALLDVEK